LIASNAHEQVNKGVFGHSSRLDAGFVLLRGDEDGTIVYRGGIGSDDDNCPATGISNIMLPIGCNGRYRVGSMECSAFSPMLIVSQS